MVPLPSLHPFADFHFELLAGHTRVILLFAFQLNSVNDGSEK